MEKRFIFWIVFFLFSASPVNSIWGIEQPYITLGSATLKLGMSKKEVLKYLDKQEMQLRTTSPNDEEFGKNSFWVASKYQPQDALGQIIFKADKLVFISKYWGSFDDKNAFTFVKSLFSALRNTMKKEDSIASIVTSIYSQPTYESKNIDLRIGPYELNLNCVENLEPSNFNTVSITQKLQDYQNFP